MPPTGFKRSRALWDNALRRPHGTTSKKYEAMARAILYELQPIRFRQVDTAQWNLYIRSGFLSIRQFSMQTIPNTTRTVARYIRTITLKQYMILFGVGVYYVFVRKIHDWLEAGPIVLIVTALVAIFTVGLDDNANKDGISAYSVFNRGFQRILGTVDAEALLAQHVGGAMGGGIPVAGMVLNGGQEDVGGGNNVIDEPIMRPAAARRREVGDDDDDEWDADDDDDDDYMDSDGEQNNNNDNNQGRGNNGGGNGARRSGKKARRRNLELRRELRRQREAARAMGFQDNEDGDLDLAAVQQLIEQQIRNEQQQHQQQQQQ